MISEKLMNVVLGAILLIALLVIGGAGVHIFQLNQQLTEANNTIAAYAKNVAVLDTAVTIQNDAIDSLSAETDAAIEKSEQALADLKPFVQEEEWRILGIRSAQYSSISNGASERIENIRQKMLKDALL
jgi:cell division protein FtsB